MQADIQASLDPSQDISRLSLWHRTGDKYTMHASIGRAKITYVIDHVDNGWSLLYDNSMGTDDPVYVDRHGVQTDWLRALTAEGALPAKYLHASPQKAADQAQDHIEWRVIAFQGTQEPEDEKPTKSWLRRVLHLATTDDIQNRVVARHMQGDSKLTDMQYYVLILLSESQKASTALGAQKAKVAGQMVRRGWLEKQWFFNQYRYVITDIGLAIMQEENRQRRDSPITHSLDIPESLQEWFKSTHGTPSGLASSSS